MEKTKKSLGIVAIVMTFVLLAGVVGYVVYAAITQSFNFGGTVKFEAEGVEATVGNAEWEGCTVNGVTASDDDTLHEFTYSTTKSKDTSGDYLSTWQDLTVVITDTTDGTATISFDVTNNFTDDTTISVTIGDTVFGTGTEATTTNEDITIVADPNYATIAAQGSQTFTITFTVDPSHDLDETTFSIPVTIEVVEETVTEDNGVTYTLSASGTAAVTGYSGDATSVEIASEVSGSDASAAALSLDSLVSAQSGTTYTVKIIAPNAFSGATSITTLTLPSSIEMIGANAFEGCENLTKLVNPSEKVIDATNLELFGLTDGQVTISNGSLTVTLIGSEWYAVEGDTSYTQCSANGVTFEVSDGSAILVVICGCMTTAEPNFDIKAESLYYDINPLGSAMFSKYTPLLPYSLTINDEELLSGTIDSDGSAYYHCVLLNVTEDLEIVVTITYEATIVPQE